MYLCVQISCASYIGNKNLKKCRTNVDWYTVANSGNVASKSGLKKYGKSYKKVPVYYAILY